MLGPNSDSLLTNERAVFGRSGSNEMEVSPTRKKTETTLADGITPISLISLLNLKGVRIICQLHQSTVKSVLFL